MSDQGTLIHAAQVLTATSAGQRADTALRFYFEHHRHLQPPARRAISGAVFGYFRWLGWLESKGSLEKRIEHAATLQERFTADEKSVKAAALAARAVPTWVREEVDFPT